MIRSLVEILGTGLRVLINIFTELKATPLLQAMVLALIASIIMIVVLRRKLAKRFSSLERIEATSSREGKRATDIHGEELIESLVKKPEFQEPYEQEGSTAELSESMEKTQHKEPPLKVKTLPQHMLSNIKKIKIESRNEEFSLKSSTEYIEEGQRRLGQAIRKDLVKNEVAPHSIDASQLINLLKELNSSIKELHEKLTKKLET